MTRHEDVPQIRLDDVDVVRDPFAAFGSLREQSALARMTTRGPGRTWLVTRYDAARTMLADGRFQMIDRLGLQPAGIPTECLKYMRTLSQRDGDDHRRLRGLVAPALSAQRLAGFRPTIETTVRRLLDELPSHADDGVVDLLRCFAWRLPIELVNELLGVPAAHRERWRRFAAILAAGASTSYVLGLPVFLDDIKVIARSVRRDGGRGLLGELAHTLPDDGTDDVELVSVIWQLVLAGAPPPANLLANSIAALLANPEQRAAVCSDREHLPRSVDELNRWCGPTKFAMSRRAREDVVLEGVPIRKGDTMIAVLLAANHDPRAYDEPERLDVTRRAGARPHLGFGHGRHHCLGAALARAQVEIGLDMLFDRFPDVRAVSDAGAVERVPDPAAWRLASLPVVLSGRGRSGRQGRAGGGTCATIR